MDLKLKLWCVRDSNNNLVPGVYFQDGGYSLAYVPVEKAAELLIPLWESHSDREIAIKTVALRLEYLERGYESPILGKPGDRKIEHIILKHFGIENGFDELEAQLYGVWY